MNRAKRQHEILDHTKFEMRLAALKSRVEKQTSLINQMPVIPWNISPPMDSSFRMGQQYSDFAQKFLNSQIDIIEKAAGSTNMLNINVGHHVVVDATEVANLVLLFSVYVRSSPQRFEDLYTSNTYENIINICLNQRSLVEYLSYFLAHVTTAGTTACEAVLIGETRIFLQKIPWNGRSMPGYEIVFKIWAISNMAKYVLIKKKLMEGVSMLKLMREYINSICELYRSTFETTTIKSPPMTCVITNTIKFFKNLGKEATDPEKMLWFGWDETDQKLIQKLCTLLNMELVSQEIKCVIMSTITSITPNFTTVDSARMFESLSDRNLILSSCKVVWINLNTDPDPHFLQRPIVDGLLHTLRNLVVKFTFSQEPDFFTPFKSLLMESVKQLDAEDFYKKLRAYRVESNFVCLQYALETTCLQDHYITIHFRLVTVLDAYADGKFDDQQLIYYTLNTLCNLFTHDIVDQVDLPETTNLLFRILYEKPLDYASQSMIFRCLFNMCFNEPIGHLIIDLGYPKIFEYLDLDKYHEDVFIDALCLIACILHYNPEAFFSRVEAQHLMYMYKSIFYSLFCILNPKIPDIKFGKENKDQKVLDLIISITFDSVSVRDSEIMQMLADIGYDRSILQFGFAKEGDTHTEMVHEIHTIMDAWKRKREKIFDRITIKYGIRMDRRKSTDRSMALHSPGIDKRNSMRKPSDMNPGRKASMVKNAEGVVNRRKSSDISSNYRRKSSDATDWQRKASDVTNKVERKASVRRGGIANSRTNSVVATDGNTHVVLAGQNPSELPVVLEAEDTAQ